MRKAFPLLSLLVVSLLALQSTSAQDKVEEWGRFEIVLKHAGNGDRAPHAEVSATFTHRDTSITVSGFYDGDQTYRIRFMPIAIGTWKYVTASTAAGLGNTKGAFECVKAAVGNHGMVRVDGAHDFKYDDGARYFPFGTTAYAWTHMRNEMQELSLATLAKSGFNKIRMCVLPKDFVVNDERPDFYPFRKKEVRRDSSGRDVVIWDFDSFDPVFFRRLEKRIDDLSALGIEADLILFHPYDNGTYGFDAMPMDVNLKYVRYVTARLSSFRNVWWSLANEFDYVKSKRHADWDVLAKAVVAADPYRHLCSIHGSTATYYEYWKPEFTHVSIQDNAPVENFGGAAILRNVYNKPVIYDEVNYEGNLDRRWGRLSGEEMTYQIWLGVIAGTYVTHGESYAFKDDGDMFLGKGGILKGSSWKRIAFLRKVVEDGPGPLQLADISRDHNTATAGDGCYIIYFGKAMNDSWLFNIPAKNAGFAKPHEGMRYKVEVIDTWNMTITECPQIFIATAPIDYRVYDKQFGRVRLPFTPYLALRIREITQ